MAHVEEKLNDMIVFIEQYTDNFGYPPSVREMCEKLSIKSTATCQYYLNKLVDRGIITKSQSNAKRSISLIKSKKTNYISVPVIGTVTAGTPIFAYENLEEYCPLPAEFGSDDDTFMLKVKGESMIEAGIYNGDKIIVKKQNTAQNGEIVVAYFDESATVKRFYKKDGKIILHPENRTMTDIVLDDVTILGTVKGLLRKF
ncbi:MAG: transcriptional repressor LexA [Clostridia bacterium]|nr:transcriptional repressor LexA [Clostridia bacterium]